MVTQSNSSCFKLRIGSQNSHICTLTDIAKWHSPVQGNPKTRSPPTITLGFLSPNLAGPSNPEKCSRFMYYRVLLFFSTLHILQIYVNDIVININKFMLECYSCFLSQCKHWTPWSWALSCIPFIVKWVCAQMICGPHTWNGIPCLRIRLSISPWIAVLVSKESQSIELTSISVRIGAGSSRMQEA